MDEFKGGGVEPKYEDMSLLEQAKYAIRTAGNGIRDEQRKSGQPWAVCFGTPIFQLETILLRLRDRRELTPDDWQRYQQRIEQLKAKKEELSEAFSEKGISPDSETQQTLINRLDVFNEELYSPKEPADSK